MRYGCDAIYLYVQDESYFFHSVSVAAHHYTVEETIHALRHGNISYIFGHRVSSFGTVKRGQVGQAIFNYVEHMLL